MEQIQAESELLWACTHQALTTVATDCVDRTDHENAEDIWMGSEKEQSNSSEIDSVAGMNGLSW